MIASMGMIGEAYAESKEKHMKFTKMEGAGNDYIYIDCFQEKVDNPKDLAIKMSDRHFGVGGDGIILIEPSDRADAFMHMFNADGSEGAMCGNGIRCTAKYIYDHGIVSPETPVMKIETKSGIKEIRYEVKDGKLYKATVDMGEVKLDSELPEKILIDELSLSFVGIDTGNPHAVYFLEDNPVLGKTIYEIDFSRYGHSFETHIRFPNRVNSEFIELKNRKEINFRVYERGSGETLACGTGATAAVVAGNLLGKLDEEVLVHLLGGDLTIFYDKESRHAFMSGEAREVFSGIWEE